MKTKRQQRIQKQRLEKERQKVEDRRAREVMLMTKPKGTTYEAPVMRVIPERKFLGKTEGFTDRAEQQHEKRHLKAYLKGDKEFRHGFNKSKEPLWFPVLEQLN